MKIIIKNSQKNEEVYAKYYHETYLQELKSYRKLIIQKPWGHEFVCSEFDNISILVLHIKKDEETSLHVHSDKDTPMILAQGSLTIKTLEKEYSINIGQVIILNRKIFHKLCSHSDDTILLEFEMFHPNKNDLIRISDKYSREMLQYEGKNNIIKDAHLHPEYFEYYDDSNDTFTKNFKNSKITFRKGIFDDKILNNSIIIILNGKIQIEGKYIDNCSILKGFDILYKNIMYLSENFIYMQYDILSL